MKKNLLISLLFGVGITQTSFAAIVTFEPNNTLVHTITQTTPSTNYGSTKNIYTNNSDAYVSNNDKTQQAIDNLSNHAKQKEYQLTSLTSQLTYQKEIQTDSFDEIKKWAEQGSAKYQGKLALIYENGDGVPQDYKKALEWLKKSADQDYAISESWLGLKYYAGEGVRQDYKKSLEWLRKAVNHEDEPRFEAEIIIGLMYELGQGVRRNKITAKEWYGKSCDNGYQDGCDQYKRLNLE